MSNFEDRLKKIPVGSIVQLTQSNGLSITGVIKENDGKESLSIEVKMDAVLKYSSISAINLLESSIANKNVEENETPQIVNNEEVADEQEIAPESTAANIYDDYTDIKSQCPIFSSGLGDFEKAFKSLDKDARLCVQGQLSKIRTGVKMKNPEKIEQGVYELADIMNEKKLDYDPLYNMFLGYGYFLADLYHDAILSFYYGQDIHAAFTCAITKAIKKKSIELYSEAAAYSALYIIKEPNGDYIDEAFTVLEAATLETGDLYAIKYAAETQSNEQIISRLTSLAEKCIAKVNKEGLQEPVDTKNMLDLLEREVSRHDTESQIKNIIDDIIYDNPSADFPLAGNNEENSEEKGNKELSPTLTDIDVNKEYSGRIISFNFFERRGIIENDQGVQFPFESSNVPDANFRAKVDSLSKKGFEPIVVQFHLSKILNKIEAVKIKKCKDISVIKTGIAYANVLFSSQKFTEALEEYRKMLPTNNWEDAFMGMLNCYLVMDNNKTTFGEEINYIAKMTELVKEYGDRIQDSIRNLSVIHQYYIKIADYKRAIEILDRLMSISEEKDYKRILYCSCEKARCYMRLKDYESAIEQYLYWLNLVADNKYSDMYHIRSQVIYNEIAEAYFQNKDYDNAEKYSLMSQSKNKKAMLEAIEEKRAEIKQLQNEDIQEEYIVDESEDNDDAEDQTEIYNFGNIEDLINEYTDSTPITALGMSAKDMLNKAFSFPHDKQYCLITYLTAAANASKDSEYAEALYSADFCIRAASGNILNEENAVSMNILYEYEIFKELSPVDHEAIIAAAAIRTLFNDSKVPDYEQNLLIKALEETELIKKSPCMLSAANELLEFKNKTGYGISKFADYKTDRGAYNRIIENANKCRESLDLKISIYENKGRLRRTRSILFMDPESVFRKALNIACEDDKSKIKEVKDALGKVVVKDNKPFSFENIDNNKIELIIDDAWDKAREMMIAEKRHVNRPYEHLINPKRRNVSETIYRIMKCIFEWIDYSERNSDSGAHYASFIYSSMRDDILAHLKDARKQVKTEYKKNGFDWGVELLKKALAELAQKIGGEYNELTYKYQYIDFLRSDYILLDEDFQPEVYSTFNNMPNFNILTRIEKHAQMELPEFSDRIDDLFSNDISKNNLRSASLLKTYGEEMHISEITEHSMYNYLEKCISVGRERLKDIHEDFINQLELYQSYGSLSDINGEKSLMQNTCDLFFRICFTNYDFGFYANLINAFNENIAVSSENIAERLNKQLDELELNSKYDWGIYSKEEIRTFISERNFSVAENIMNCIRRNDTKELADLSIEPFSYLMGFLNEHSINYKAVSDNTITLKSAIQKYTGKANIEMAIRRMTNNASKDVKGSQELIERWLTKDHANAEKIALLMNSLGFKNISVVPENGTTEESYIITKEKQTGRVHYHYPLPAYSSVLEQEGARILCLYDKFDADKLIDKYKEVNTTSKHTIVLLDYALKIGDRKKLARKLKNEKVFSKTFILIDRVILYYLALHYQSNTIDKTLMAITMPFSYYQPFSATSKLGTMPPELYTGRTSELRSIEDPNGCNLVYGGRQLGKSALLSMAAKHIDKNANGDRAIVVDIVNKDYKAAARSVSENLVDAHILSEGSECDDWETLARHIGRRLADDNPETRIGYLLLMLDEADAFIDSCKAIGYTPISVFKNLPEGRFKLVMAGLHNLSNFNRSILQNNSVLPHLESIIVRPFQRPEGTELLTHALAYMGFRFEPDVIQLILAKTNYFPGLIQLYCQKLLEAMQNDDYAGYSEISSPPYEVTESHIKKVLSDKSFTEEINKRLWMTLTVNEEEGSYYMIIALILAYLNFEHPDIKGYSMEELKEVAMSFNINTILDLEEEQLNEILMEMWDLNILTADETTNGYRYMFSSEGFRDLLGSKENVEKGLEKYIM